MRKRNAIAAIVVSGIMVGGAGIALGGEAAEGSPAGAASAQVRTDKSSGIGSPAASGLAVNSVAEATDAVIQKVGDGRVTEVAFTQSNGTTQWKVTIDQGKGPVQVTLDAATGEIVRSAGVTTSDDCGTGPGTGTGSGSGTGDDFDDDDDDDDDDGPIREGVNPSK